ncbi:MAG: hypothetical protein HDQ89_01730 [Desulfovibrio sp.]|nr:hypothetical protein [Desulfovibrio sp.]
MWPNVFLNAYQQPENKLTYNFLCLLSHYQPKEFIEYLLEETLPGNTRIQNFEDVYGGGESNPDGRLDIISGNREFFVFLEIKTFRRKVDLEQLQRHVVAHCEGEPDSLLLVITADKRDKEKIRSLGDARIKFRSWEEIAGYISKHSDDRIARDFVRYGQELGEFEGPMDITKDDIEIFTSFVKSKWTQKIDNVLNRTIELIGEKGDFPIPKAELDPQDAWGRKVIKITFPHTQKNDYGQWLACGIYYDTKDHGIRFNSDGTPELAFFLDMSLGRAKNLPAEIKKAFKALSSKEFEENTEGQITNNRWRVLFKRIPLNQVDSLEPDFIKDFLYGCLTEISQSPALAPLLSIKPVKSCR